MRWREHTRSTCDELFDRRARPWPKRRSEPLRDFDVLKPSRFSNRHTGLGVVGSGQYSPLRADSGMRELFWPTSAGLRKYAFGFIAGRYDCAAVLSLFRPGPQRQAAHISRQRNAEWS
jgi:hypothetical protein